MHSLSSAVFLVFALGIWTLRYELLVSGSSCSLFGCTFLAQCLVRLWIHVLRLQIPWCSFLGWSSTCPLVCNDRALVRQWRQLWFRSCSSSLVIDILISMVQTFQQIIEIPLSLFVFGGRCPRCEGRADSQVQAWRRQSSPTVAAVENFVEIPCVFLDKVVDMPFLFYDRCLVFGCRKLRFSAVAVCLAVGGATDAVHRLFLWTPRLHRDRTWLRCVIRVRMF